MTITTETQVGLAAGRGSCYRVRGRTGGHPGMSTPSAHQGHGRGGDPSEGSQGGNRATLLTSCWSVLAATETEGDTSGFGAWVSCSPAELLCENKGGDTVGRRELPEKSDSDCTVCPTRDPGSHPGPYSHHVPSESTSLTAALPSPRATALGILRPEW